MALKFNDLKTLAKTVANANPSSPVAYSWGEDKFNYSDLQDTLRAELNELAGTYSLYRENKNTVFALIEDTIDDVTNQSLHRELLKHLRDVLNSSSVKLD